ncbi:MAG: hypothetical protein GC190_15390 [Alphaproteobacteria bacterium]|nr:hypothetical protein [Alphaproteobacteria bacterium]
MSEKSDKADKKSKSGVPLPSGATDLRSRVPEMADGALATLLANAQRMLTSGNAVQQAAAGDLIPVIETELAERKAKKAAAKPRKGRARKATSTDNGDGAA